MPDTRYVNRPQKEKIKTKRQRLVEIERKWVEMLTFVAKGGAISYSELKRLSVYEFLMLHQNRCEEIKNKK